MPVIFQPFGNSLLPPLNSGSPDLQRFTSLLGKPFPNEEVEALWSMMPGQWYVEWYHNRMEFGLRRRAFAEIGDHSFLEPLIKAVDADDVDIWRQAFAALVTK